MADLRKAFAGVKADIAAATTIEAHRAAVLRGEVVSADLVEAERQLRAIGLPRMKLDDREWGELRWRQDLG